MEARIEVMEALAVKTSRAISMLWPPGVRWVTLLLHFYYT